MPFAVQQGDPAIRFGCYLRPSYAISRAQAGMHGLLERQFGIIGGGVFMPHATIKGFFRTEASVGQVRSTLDAVVPGYDSFPVFNTGPQPWGKAGIALNVNTDGTGQPNLPLRAFHTAVYDAILPLVHPDCEFTFAEPTRDQFNAHLTLAMADIPAFAFDEIMEFVRDAGEIGESTFTARHIHLYAFRSEAWIGAWWETLRWQLLQTWTLADPPQEVNA